MANNIKCKDTQKIMTIHLHESSYNVQNLPNVL